jgi:lipoprotein-anchoring transpeptidase ErfK/SrfK
VNRTPSLPVVVLCLLVILAAGALWVLSEEPPAMAIFASSPTATATAITTQTPIPTPTTRPSPFPTWTPTFTPAPTRRPTSTSPPPMPTGPSPTPTETPFPLVFHGRWIDVNLTRQQLVAFEREEVIRVTLVSTGKSQTPTPTGLYRIHTKLRYDDMSGPDYYLRKVPYVMYFYRDYALHGTYWHTNFGHTASHGCINLPTPEAEWLYNWAAVGTPVNVHE